MRKKRSDNKLAALNPEQKAMLRTWLVDENLSYVEARQRLIDDFNVTVSTGALTKFYATECFAMSQSSARAFAEQVEKQVLASDSTFDRATLALIKQKAFERAVAKNGNIDELATLAGIIGDSAKLELKKKDQQLAERRIAILEKKAAQADEAKQVNGRADLSDEEKLARYKQIFGG